MNVFETVKAAVSMRQAAKSYGLKVNRGGMVCCPFHTDKHPSLKLNEDYFYCFGCGVSGDVIDLVSRLFGLSLYEAARKLAADFGIDTGRPPPPSVIVELNRRKEALAAFERERQCVDILTDYERLLRDWKVRYAPQSPQEPMHDRFVEACHRLDYVEYLLDEFEQADKTGRAEIVSMLTANGKLKALKQRIKLLREEDEPHEPGREYGIAM